MEILNEKNFAEKIKSGIVLVDFYADWCGPCRMMTPILQNVQAKLEGKAQIYKVNVDDSESLARKYGVMSIPTFFIFANGEQKEKHVGLWAEDDVLAAIKKHI